MCRHWKPFCICVVYVFLFPCDKILCFLLQDGTVSQEIGSCVPQWHSQALQLVALWWSLHLLLSFLPVFSNYLFEDLMMVLWTWPHKLNPKGPCFSSVTSLTSRASCCTSENEATQGNFTPRDRATNSNSWWKCISYKLCHENDIPIPF